MFKAFHHSKIKSREITLFYNKKQAGQQVNGIPSAIFAGEDEQIGLVA